MIKVRNCEGWILTWSLSAPLRCAVHVSFFVGWLFDFKFQEFNLDFDLIAYGKNSSRQQRYLTQESRLFIKQREKIPRKYSYQRSIYQTT